ncbi:sulfatase-like hydrolase/transferase [Acinetobacter sp. YH12239]|uniref:sulfatase-like hydrolase/transferase n=1 Tax=Acinetobacter sp. YH12239 TaxID=2601166 RepID=UPI0015D250CD|nr:sulfatase-like hydrolase/transferase [Acinetobacter sp. YH12239]
MKIIYILLANFVLVALASYLGVGRPLINYDYLLVLLIFLFFRNRFLAVILFALCIFIDGLNIFFQIFPIIHLSDILYLFKFIPEIDHSKKIIISFGLLSLFIYLFFLLEVLGKFSISKKYFSYVVVIVILLSILQSFYIAKGERAWRIGESKYFDSQIYNFIKFRNADFIKKFKNSENALGERYSFSTGYDEVLRIENPKKILFIVNESWGVTSDEIQEDLLHEILNNKRFKLLKQSEVSTDGFTVNAEIRELCGLYLNNFNLKKQKNGFEQCLPHILSKRGFHTLGVHGAASTMYERKDWYPKLGFKESLFYENFLNLNSRCYSFPGLCDRDLMQVIRNKLMNHDQIFLYWLTLNTHLSYDLRDLKNDQFDCERFLIDGKSSLCRNLKLQKQFFSNIGELLIQSQLSGTMIIIVGDHVPPLLENNEIKFKDAKVPMIVGYIE